MPDPTLDEDRSLAIREMLVEHAEEHRPARRHSLYVGGALAIAATLAVAAIVVGVGASRLQVSAPDRPLATDARDAYFDAVTPGESTAWLLLFRELRDILPNTRFVSDDPRFGPPRSFPGVVTGTVDSATAGPESSNGNRLLTLDIRIEDCLAAAECTPVMPISLYVDADRVTPAKLSGLAEQLGRVVIVLSDPESDSQNPSIELDGALLGLVADDGSLSFPALVESTSGLPLRETTFLGSIRTVRQLREAAGLPERTVEADLTHLGIHPDQ